MVQGARYAYVLLAVATVAAIVLQVFFIGLGLFAGSDKIELHRNFGWLLHLVVVILPVVAALAAVGRVQILQAIGLAVVVWLVPILAALKTDAPVAAAFHPVGALLAFWLATLVVSGSVRLARTNDVETRTTIGEWVGVVVVAAVLLFLSLSGSPST